MSTQLERCREQARKMVLQARFQNQNWKILTELENKYNLKYHEINKLWIDDGKPDLRVAKNLQIFENKLIKKKGESNMQIMMTTNEACDMLNVTARTLYTYVKKGMLQQVKINKTKNLYYLHEVEHLAQSNPVKEEKQKGCSMEIHIINHCK